jgi:hypothetical protein
MDASPGLNWSDAHPMDASPGLDWADVDRELLASIFAQLPFRLMGVVSLVCRRWALVAADPHWKPELVVYAWGEAHVTGVAQACARPTLLEFSLQQPVVQIACANEATLALTASGDVWCWGVYCTKPSAPLYQLETSAQPRRVRGLREVAQIACSSPGYYHSRAKHQYLYHCAAVGRDGSLFTWGNCDVGQLCAQPCSSGAQLAPGDEIFAAAQLGAHGHISWVKEPMRVCQFGPPAAGAAAGAHPVTRRVLRAACGFHVTVLAIETVSPFDFETAEREWCAARAAGGLAEAEAEHELDPPSPSRSNHSADFSDGALPRCGSAARPDGGGGGGGGSADDSESGSGFELISIDSAEDEAAGEESDGGSAFDDAHDGADGASDGGGGGGGGGDDDDDSDACSHACSESGSDGSDGDAELAFEDQLEAEMAFDAALHAAVGELDGEPDDDDDDDDGLGDNDEFRERAETQAERAAYAERALRVELRAAPPAAVGGGALWLGGEVGGRLVVPTQSRRPATWRALLLAGLPTGAALLTPCGRQLVARGGRVVEARLTVESCGRWCNEMSHPLSALRELEGVPLKSLDAGAFHCCAVSPAGQLFAFGDQVGRRRRARAAALRACPGGWRAVAWRLSARPPGRPAARPPSRHRALAPACASLTSLRPASAPVRPRARAERARHLQRQPPRHQADRRAQPRRAAAAARADPRGRG